MGRQKQVKRNYFHNIHISKAKIKRQIDKHPVLCFSYKTENALESFLLFFYSILAPVREAQEDMYLRIYIMFLEQIPQGVIS